MAGKGVLVAQVKIPLQIGKLLAEPEEFRHVRTGDAVQVCVFRTSGGFTGFGQISGGGGIEHKDSLFHSAPGQHPGYPPDIVVHHGVFFPPGLAPVKGLGMVMLARTHDGRENQVLADKVYAVHHNPVCHTLVVVKAGIPSSGPVQFTECPRFGKLVGGRFQFPDSMGDAVGGPVPEIVGEQHINGRPLMIFIIRLYGRGGSAGYLGPLMLQIMAGPADVVFLTPAAGGFNAVFYP